MNKEKQIEKMAKIICGMENGCDDCMFNKALCYERNDAEALYNAGYRKASDVVLEAIDDFQSRLRNVFCTMCNDNDYNTVCLLEIDSAIECLFDVFVAEIKKKYTEGGE